MIQHEEVRASFHHEHCRSHTMFMSLTLLAESEVDKRTLVSFAKGTDTCDCMVPSTLPDEHASHNN